MKTSATWSAFGGLLIALPCAFLLTLVLAVLVVGHIVRGLGSMIVNAANFAQRGTMRGMARADNFLYPPGTDPLVPGSNEPQ